MEIESKYENGTIVKTTEKDGEETKIQIYTLTDIIDGIIKCTRLSEQLVREKPINWEHNVKAVNAELKMWREYLQMVEDGLSVS